MGRTQTFSGTQPSSFWVCRVVKSRLQPQHMGDARLTDPLTCPKCQGEMRLISFIDQPDVIKKTLQHLGLWEESQAPPQRHPPIKEITFDPSYSQLI